MSPSLVSPVLVGRHAELDRLRDALRLVATGEPAVVLLGGEAGVGKSRLVETLAEDARRQGMEVLVGGCLELGGDGAPFAPLLDALRALARTRSPQDLDRLLGPARRELSRLLPEFELAGDPSPADDDGARPTSQLLELVLGLVSRLAAERPLVLVAEDLHWADRSTLDLVAFLARAARAIPVLLVLTYRSDEIPRNHPLRPLLSAWERMRSVERLQLTRFGREEVAAQLAAIAQDDPEPALVELVYSRSEGNAFLVEEIFGIVRDGRDPQELPPSLRDVLLTRTELLSPAAQRLLRIASVAGRNVPERLLAAVSGLPDEEMYSALRDAVDQAQLVVDESGRGYSFRHALAREAVYRELLPGERVRLHTAYATALEADPTVGGDEVTRTASLAQHWYAAFDLPRCLAASASAGRAAAASFAPAEALRHFERVLEVWDQVPDAAERISADQVEMLRLAARAAFHVGAVDRAASLIREALALAEASGDELRAALLLEQLATTLRASGDEVATAAMLESAAQRVPESPPTQVRASVLAALASSLLWLGDHRASQVAERAIEAARAAGARQQEAHALITLGTALGHTGQEDEGGLAALRQGLSLAEALGDHETTLRGYVNLSDALQTFARHAEAVQVATTGIALAERLGFVSSFGAYLSGNAAESLMALGEWDRAEALTREAQSADLSGVFASSLDALRADIAAARGDQDAARRYVAAARRALINEDNPQFTLPLAAVDATVALQAGDPVAARETAVSALSSDNSWMARYAWPLVWLGVRAEADLAVAARQRGEPAPPEDGTLRTVAGRLPSLSPAALTYARLADAERARAAATAQQQAAWETAVAAARVAGDPRPLGYALYRLAESCAGDDRLLARDAAHEAAGLGRSLGLRPLLTDVETLSRRARLGVPSPRDAVDDAAPPAAAQYALTARELAVLELVAAGRSNAQIGSTLFISPKTVSVHVSNILAKLGASSRQEAAAVARDVGLLGAAPPPS